VKAHSGAACQAWQLLVRFYYAQRSHLPTVSWELDLSPAQCHLLHVLEPERPMPMGKLAQSLACDASNVTGLVDRLESRGLLRRAPSSEDRRVKVLELTPAGAKLRAQLLDKVTTAPPASLERLTPAQQRELAKILAKLLE
jgi:DNA-binding MarR family transcriptional regulator